MEQGGTRRVPREGLDFWMKPLAFSCTHMGGEKTDLRLVDLCHFASTASSVVTQVMS